MASGTGTIRTASAAMCPQSTCPHAKQIWAQNRPYRISLEAAHPPACSAALIEVGKAVRAGMTAFAVISGDAPGLARAVALAAFAPRGGSSRKEDQSYD